MKVGGTTVLPFERAWLDAQVSELELLEEWMWESDLGGRGDACKNVEPRSIDGKGRKDVVLRRNVHINTGPPAKPFSGPSFAEAYFMVKVIGPPTTRGPLRTVPTEPKVPCCSGKLS